MDQRVIETLQAAGIDTSFERSFLALGVECDQAEKPLPLTGKVMVMQGEQAVAVELQPISALLVGSARPPSFQAGPTPEYEALFLLIESTALNYCLALDRPEYDEELARLYNLLRRRPDGSDANPLFGYLQGAVRLYLSLRDTSAAELEAVLNRLTRSAKCFSSDVTSSNYLRTLTEHLPTG